MRQFLESQLAHARAWGPAALYGAYIALGAVRGFTLVPSTTLVLAAVPFVPPGSLLICTVIEMPIIIGWSFFPLVPTDLICYVCGVLRVRFWKFLLGVTLGEGAICAIYIYGGNQILRWIGFKS